MSKLILRHAAGEYWLLDISQTTVEYKKPLQLNEVGARIFTLYDEGKNEQEIVEVLSGEYEVEGTLLANDVNAFIKKIEAYKN